MSSLENLSVFVISMPGETKRRARIQKVMDEAGLNFEFFDATDGRQFDLKKHPEYDRKRRLRYYGRDLLGAELGCTLSHKRLYQYMTDQNIDQALIFEDDITLYEPFVETLEALVTKCTVPYDMVRFMGRDKVMRTKQRKVCQLTDTTYLTRFPGAPGGAYAYVVTQAGARKMLRHMDKIMYPIDFLMGRSWITGLNWFCIYPKTAYPDMELESYIGDGRFNKDPQISGLARLCYPFCRFWLRTCEAFGKKYWYYATYLRDKKNYG